MPEIYTATGAKVFIAPSVATTPANAAAYAALTWTEIGFLESIGEFGDESSIVTAASIGDGRMRKAKGARDGGTMTLTIFPDAVDVGQVALVAAEATQSNYPFKITEPNRLNATGTDGISYFKGLVSSKRKNVGGNDNVVRLSFNIGVNSVVVEVAPTAGA